MAESSTVASCAPLCLLLSSTDCCFPPIVATESEWLSWFENRLVWCEGKGEQLKAHTSRSNSGFLSQKLSRALWRELTFPWPGSPAVWTIDVTANIMSSHLYINTETASHPCDSHWAALSGCRNNWKSPSPTYFGGVHVYVYIQVRKCVCVLMHIMCRSVCIRLHFQTVQYCVCACVGMYVCMCSPWEMKTLTQFNTPVSRCTLAQYSITHTHSHTQTHTPQPDSSGVQLSNITLS